MIIYSLMAIIWHLHNHYQNLPPTTTPFRRLAITCLARSSSLLHSMTFLGEARYMCIDLSEEALEWRRLLDRARQVIASRPFALDDDGDDGGWPAPASTAMPPLDPAMFAGGDDDDDDDDDAKEWIIL